MIDNIGCVSGDETNRVNGLNQWKRSPRLVGLEMADEMPGDGAIDSIGFIPQFLEGVRLDFLALDPFDLVPRCNHIALRDSATIARASSRKNSFSRQHSYPLRPIFLLSTLSAIKAKLSTLYCTPFPKLYRFVLSLGLYAAIRSRILIG